MRALTRGITTLSALQAAIGITVGTAKDGKYKNYNLD